MRIVWRLFLAFVLSGVAGMAALVQLGVFFNADVELVAAMLVFVVLTLFATIVFAMALAAGRSVDRTAVGLLIALGLAVVGLGIWSYAAMPTPGAVRRDLPATLYMFVPGALMIGVQWLLLRRLRRAVADGE